ncbi:hypothetical protein [Thermasporomyces composti]|uniref:Uncharacterized protein n=1 Tax=Thermasporomyces composti TaxID=696763 RepID=A0A3D9VDX9_THECX|nr:hypothetical protein [Thermasporomyces composti]REF35531.1 hypothetical protein DFJ64_0912 [Thermasporomyces composti]
MANLAGVAEGHPSGSRRFEWATGVADCHRLGRAEEASAVSDIEVPYEDALENTPVDEEEDDEQVELRADQLDLEAPVADVFEQQLRVDIDEDDEYQ